MSSLFSVSIFLLVSTTICQFPLSNRLSFGRLLVDAETAYDQLSQYFLLTSSRRFPPSMSHGPNSPFSGAFSMGKAQRSSPTNPNQFPGPGTYEPPHRKNKGYPFQRAMRKPIYEPTSSPEPGHYENQFRAIANQGPAHAFPKAGSQEEKRFPLGPGSYNPVDPLKKAPAFTFQSRFEFAANESLKYPGPGSYTLQEVKTEKASNKGFSTGKRTDLILSKGPGPGQYNVDMHQPSVQIKFPKSQRSLESSQMVPGPGAFDLTLPKKVGSTFGQKIYSQTDKSEVPGPGSYILKSFLDNKKGVSMGRPQQSNHVLKSEGPSMERSKDDLKGKGPPHCYDIQKFKFPTRHASIGSSVRGEIQTFQETPGPAAYRIDSQLMTVGGIIPKAPKEQIHVEKLPGPGRYNPNDLSINKKGPSYHIAGKYEKPMEHSILGPGRYDIHRDLGDGPKYKFGTDERSRDGSSIDQNASHCYEVRQSVGFIPPYLQSRVK